jgi:N-acetyl-anhydromuramyl-L-alanine amidase AmpD
LVTKGRPDLAGPLAQLHLARDGTFTVIAAGRANHAGAGSWRGITTGNSSFVGIEAENAGDGTDPWPDVQMDAYARGVAAILNHVGASSSMAVGHKEYALPPGRKIDPSFNMVAFRTKVQAYLS